MERTIAVDHSTTVLVVEDCVWKTLEMVVGNENVVNLVQASSRTGFNVYCVLLSVPMHSTKHADVEFLLLWTF